MIATTATSCVAACVVPYGSSGRPVQPVNPGGVMTSMGASVPLLRYARHGTPAIPEDEPTGPFIVPAAAFDYAFERGKYLGLEIALIHADFATGPDQFPARDAVRLILNPRFEAALTDHVSLVIEGNVAILGKTLALREKAVIPLPRVGFREYVPIGGGGFVFSQLTTSYGYGSEFFGSVSYDLPIRFSDGVAIHLFPELSARTVLMLLRPEIATVSGGLTLMVELERGSSS